MKVLLLNVHSPQNAGDLAILQETLTMLRSALPDAEITVAINDLQADKLPPEATYVPSFMRWVNDEDADGEWHWRKGAAIVYGVWLLIAAVLARTLRWHWLPRRPERRELLQTYYEADVVAVVGGGHLYARHALNIAFLWLWTGIALAPLLRKPLVMLPQSFGPLPGAFQQSLLRWLLGRAALVVAREYRSAQFLAGIGLRRRVVVMPDSAFTTEQTTPDLAQAEPSLTPLRADPKPVVGLTLMDWQGQNPIFDRQARYEDAILALIEHIDRRYGARVVLFAQCTGPTAAQDDRRIARRIAERARENALRVEIVDAALSPQVLKSAYSQLDLLVATRMHSAIFALSSAVPTLVIGYLHKSVGIMEMLGLHDDVIDIDAIDREVLCDRFDALWLRRQDVHCHMAEQMPRIRSTLLHLPVLIRESLAEHHA